MASFNDWNEHFSSSACALQIFWSQELANGVIAEEGDRDFVSALICNLPRTASFKRYRKLIGGHAAKIKHAYRIAVSTSSPRRHRETCV